ncbi:MAG: hypothetical protein P8M34_07835 [Saprospiraceae bacterium]|nr:hypothetical protein [Saprospiraceae bacterium]
MTIVRENNEIIIRIADNIKEDDVQNLMDYVKYLEATSKSKATQQEVDNLAKEVNQSWWLRNKERLLAS